MEISKETYQQADDRTQRNMIFDLTLDMHETIHGNSKPGMKDDLDETKERVASLETSVTFGKRIVLFLLAAVGLK